jgi:hypothetical protein
MLELFLPSRTMGERAPMRIEQRGEIDPVLFGGEAHCEGGVRV